MADSCEYTGCPHPALYSIGVRRGYSARCCGQHLNQMMLTFHVGAGFPVTVTGVGAERRKGRKGEGGLFK